MLISIIFLLDQEFQSNFFGVKKEAGEIHHLVFTF